MVWQLICTLAFVLREILSCVLMVCMIAVLFYALGTFGW